MIITPAPRQWIDPEMNNAIEQSTVPGSWMRLLGTGLPVDPAVMQESCTVSVVEFVSKYN